MTETEAKGKWCPMARGDRGGNRTEYGGAPDESFPEYVKDMTQLHPCVGSACMMWRKTHGPHADRAQFIDRDTMQPITVDADDGYCGLAGKP